MEEALETKAQESQHTEETPLEFFASICGVFVVGLFALTFIFQNFEIPSASMVKTLLIGDHVLVDRVSLAPPAAWAPIVHYRNIRRGDIIVFFKPNEPDLYLVNARPAAAPVRKPRRSPCQHSSFPGPQRSLPAPAADSAGPSRRRSRRPVRT